MQINLLRKLPPAGVRIRWQEIIYTIFGYIFLQNHKQKLTNDVKKYFNVKYCFFVNSGRSALALILLSLMKKDKRRELIMPGYTCFSVPASIKRAGLKIRLIDFSNDSFEYNFKLLEKAINPETLAVILVYPFGLSVNVTRIKRLAETRNIYFIEDAAQAMGLKINNQYAGCIGDVGFFSLGKGKPVTSIKGGIIVTNNETIAENIDREIEILKRPSFLENLYIIMVALFMKIFINPYLYWVLDFVWFIKLGETVYNPRFKIGLMPKAAVILAKMMLKRLDEVNRERTIKANNFSKRLSQISEIKTIQGYKSQDSLFLRFPVLVGSSELRLEIYKRLSKMGISMMYSGTIETINEPDLFSEKNFPCLRANKVAERLLTLPTHDYVNDDDIKSIVSIILETISGFKRRDGQN